MSEIKDIGLYESGERKIQWVKANMPLLRALEEEFSADKPFKGLKVALSVHLEAKPHISAAFSPQAAQICILRAAIRSQLKTTLPRHS